MPATDEVIVVRADELEAGVRHLVSAMGSLPREAELVAHQLVQANLTGHDSHGVGMLPRYVEVYQQGHLNLNQHVRRVMDSGSMLALDGNAGLGQVLGHEAMELAVARAKVSGIVLVALSNAHHLGRIGHWAEQCSAAGLISIHFVNVISEPMVAPYGGCDARFVTNPFCVGVPIVGRPPILLDFATSRIAMGKVRVAMNRGELVEPGTLIDSRGDPTIDPRTLFATPHGAILPLGDHKGYCLAVVCELLGGALAGGSTLHQRPSSRAIINNMLSIVIDPASLGTKTNLQSQGNAFIEWVLQSPVRSGLDRIRMPGEPEQDYRRERLSAGIPIDLTTWRQIEEAGRSVGVELRSTVTALDV